MTPSASSRSCIPWQMPWLNARFCYPIKGNVEENEEPSREAGADQVATTLRQTRDQLSTWLPMLAHEEAKTTAHGAAREGRTVAV